VSVWLVSERSRPLGSREEERERGMPEMYLQEDESNGLDEHRPRTRGWFREDLSQNLVAANAEAHSTVVALNSAIGDLSRTK